MNRNSSLDLLRIIAMILIVAHHYVIHGGFSINQDVSMQQFMLQFLLFGGKLGVIVFVMISGYFLFERKFSFHRLIKLYGQVVFYSIVITFIFSLIQVPYVPQASLSHFYKLFFPVVYQPYWFFTSYAVLFLFTPAINAMIKHLEFKQTIFYLTISLLFFSILPSFLKINIAFDHTSRFIFYYSIGASINKYHRLIVGKNYLYGLAGFCLYIASYIYLYLTKGNLNIWSGLDSLAMILVGLLLLIYFSRMSINLLLTNQISKTTFGIYLLHDNVYLRPFIWRQLLNNHQQIDSPQLLGHAMTSIIVVFLVCALIDWFRQISVGKLFNFFYDKLSKWMTFLYHNYFTRLSSRSIQS